MWVVCCMFSLMKEKFNWGLVGFLPGVRVSQACTGHRDYREIPGGPRGVWAGESRCFF